MARIQIAFTVNGELRTGLVPLDEACRVAEELAQERNLPVERVRVSDVVKRLEVRYGR